MDYFEEMAIRSLREYRELHELRIKELEDVVRKICTITDDIHESLEHILERLHALEEKEREWARAEHQREQALDFENSEGLGRT